MLHYVNSKEKGWGTVIGSFKNIAIVKFDSGSIQILDLRTLCPYWPSQQLVDAVLNNEIDYAWGGKVLPRSFPSDNAPFEWGTPQQSKYRFQRPNTVKWNRRK